MNSIIFMESNIDGSSYEGIKAAKSLGFYVHLFTQKDHFLNKQTNCLEIDEIHMVNFEEIEKVEEKIVTILSKHQIACIISFMDSFIHLAARLSNQYCHTTLTVHAIKRMENKILTRKHLERKEYSPWYVVIQSSQSLDSVIPRVKDRFPLVLKMPLSCGSKDVFLVYSESQLRHRIRYIRNRYLHKDVMIEEYLVGPQYMVEVIAYKGEIEVVAVIEQEVTKKERFIVTGYSISSEIDQELYNSLVEVSKKIIVDLGLETGNCHLELRHIEGKWKLIEVNPRISGGVMNRLIVESHHFNYAEQILKLYIGQKPYLKKGKICSVYAHYIITNTIGILSSVTGIHKASEIPGVVSIFIKPRIGHLVIPPLAMGQRLGYVLAKGKTSKEAKTIALNAASHIQFHVVPS